MKITDLPPSIFIDVSYYDEAAKELLQKFPSASVIDSIVSKPLEIPTPEFLTNFLIHRKRQGIVGYSSVNEIKSKLTVAINIMDGCLEFSGKSIVMPSVTTDQLTEIIEHFGEAIGLSVISHIHGLHEADWNPIPIQRGRNAKKTLDFQTASDGLGIVQVENKGSAVLDNRIQANAVKKQKIKIDSKKQAAKVGPLDFHRNEIRYGTIAVMDSRMDGHVKCWILDPPSEETLIDPLSFKVLSRIKFFQTCINYISPLSPILSAISMRILDFENSNTPFDLNQVPLQKGNGQEFDFSPIDFFGHSSFSMNKSRVVDGPAVGKVFQINKRALFFLGIREALLSLVAEQDFEKILSYRFQVGLVVKEVECVFSKRAFEKIKLSEQVLRLVDRGDKYYKFNLTGALNYSYSGLVFGILPINGSK